jgi:mannose-6-phosphate isomerase-like protein (cupin superfamily)
VGGGAVGKDWDGVRDGERFGWGMEIRNRETQEPFTTKDGSTIISLLDLANAPVKNQSLAEARVPTGRSTQRHYHKDSEEFYYVLSGRGRMEIDGEVRTVGAGDAVLIPAGSWHGIAAMEELVFLCCCAPPYQHEDTYFE